MSFLYIGILVLIVSIIFLRLAIKGNDKEGVVGMTAMLIAAIILIVFFGILYSSFY